MIPSANTKCISVLLLPLAVAPSALAQQPAQPPNIIIIMVDQLRADLMQREGYPLNTMPFADSLARCGTWFNRAYTAAPASGPARVSMLTGRFPCATHVRSNHNIQDAFYTEDLFDVARRQGYATAMIGKNHSHLSKERADYWSGYNHGGQEGGRKTDKGRALDTYLGTLDMYYCMKPSPHGVEGQQPYRMVDDASQWIAGRGGKPFLMWFSMAEPHNPYQVCEPYYSMFPPETLPPLRSSAADRPAKGPQYEVLAEMMARGHKGIADNLPRMRSVYHGMIRLIDDQMARLAAELKRRNVYDNTIIVFISDHGDYAGEYGLMKKGAGLDDVLTRIPMQWSGPGIQASARPHDAHVSIVDIFPTVCEIMGAAIPQGVQGRSLWPLLQGKEYPAEEFASVMAQGGYGGMYYTRADGSDYMAEGAIRPKGLFFDELNTWTQSGAMRMLRRGDWKLVYDMDGNGRLYNLKTDPVELADRFDDPACREVKYELMEQMLRWDISTQDGLPVPRARYRFKSNEHNYLFNHEK